MFKIATGYLGISFDAYYDMTPRELGLMFDGYFEKHRHDVEMVAVAVKVGTQNATRGKNKKVFEAGGDRHRLVGSEVTRREWRALKDKFTS